MNELFVPCTETNDMEFALTQRASDFDIQNPFKAAIKK